MEGCAVISTKLGNELIKELQDVQKRSEAIQETSSVSGGLQALANAVWILAKVVIKLIGCLSTFEIREVK
jgi:hypothetical protein